MDEQRDWLEVLLNRQCKQNRVERVLGLTSEPAVSAGDNYGSDMTRVKMRVMLGSGKATTKSLVIKAMPLVEERARLITRRGVFKKEIKMYKEILPAMEDLLSDTGDWSEPLWGHCLEYRAYDRLVLQDLMEIGCKMASRKDGLNQAHATLALKGLARFHALSVVLKDKGLLDPAEYKKSIFSDEHSLVQRLLPLNLPKLIDAIQTSWGPEWAPYGTLMKALLENYKESVENSIKENDNDFKVLNHGDFWVNNILFRYSPYTDAPISLRFVDFQLCHYRSYAFDVLYFLATSVHQDVLEANWNGLVVDYQSGLCRALRHLRSRRAAPSVEEVRQELDSRSLFALVVGLTVLTMVTKDADEVVPIESVISGGDRNLFGGEALKRRVQLLLKLCEERGSI